EASGAAGAKATQASQLQNPYTSAMSPRPVPIRLVLTVALTTLVVVAACGAAIHWTGRRAVYEQQVADLERLAQLVHRWVPGDATRLGDADRARVKNVAQLLQIRV